MCHTTQRAFTFPAKLCEIASYGKSDTTTGTSYDYLREFYENVSNFTHDSTQTTFVLHSLDRNSGRVKQEAQSYVKLF